MQTLQPSKGKVIARVLFILSVAICLFHLFITMNTSVSMMQSRVIHVFSLMLVWYLYRLQKDQPIGKKVLNLFFTLLVLALGIYYLTQTTPDVIREKGIWGINGLDMIAGLLLLILILETSRQAIGLSLPIIALIFLGYAVLGPYLPNLIAHRGYNLEYITSYVCWTNEGIFGTPIGAAVSFVVLYIIFGELLDKFGSGKFFIDLAYALTGKMRGGPAEAAVLSSALMGSINGSAVANVVTTGTFTIPLMKKVGYSKEYAGAVEAVASTGGQILPPVMGAAAFVMADMTGIAYSTIILSALVPGLLYYLSLGAAVYFEAGRLGIAPDQNTKILNAKKILRQGYFHLIPLIVLIICLLGFGFSASYSALFAIGSILLIGIVRTLHLEHRFPWKELKASALHAAKSSVPVTIACASAGIVIGIVSMTGLGVRFAQIVFQLSHGNLFMMLFLTMIACIILGMGLPSTAAYVIAATVASPALLQAGVGLLASNLFVFYFAIISFITPPVAMAAYAASGIAESDSMKTGVKAFQLGIAGFIIPFLFIYYPGLLVVGTSFGLTVYAIIVAVCAVLLMAASFEGWCGTPLSLPLRLGMFCTAILFLVPNVMADITGIVLTLAILSVVVYKVRKQKGLEIAE
ncbi:TRAP transporter permease [uncultured Sphaerochaeta sp.]|uniref:TRAP transporter permease n=1 Tax=uncultured Sphaerochaeta sp. TaxID=886478 RepID=UPI002A0A599F|nr:TRAP transporter permease [uncultured Sphaerochaeta sp.]